MLFERLEEQFHLSAQRVDACHVAGAERLSRQVGQAQVISLLVVVHDADQAKDALVSTTVTIVDAALEGDLDLDVDVLSLLLWQDALALLIDDGDGSHPRWMRLVDNERVRALLEAREEWQTPPSLIAPGSAERSDVLCRGGRAELGRPEGSLEPSCSSQQRAQAESRA